MTNPSPTSEQQLAIDLARSGDNMVIEAFAGAGKTATLSMVAGALAPKNGVYTAFNRAIIDDGKGRFPDQVQCRTMHSLAFGAVGRHYKHRLNARRRRNSEVAQILGIDGIGFDVGDTRKVLDAGRCAALVMRTIGEFCQSDAMTPSVDHVPYQEGIDQPDLVTGKRGWENNRILRAHIEPFLSKAWMDMINPQGHLPFSHACYLKLWALGTPKIRGEFILFDEAQDASAVFMQILRQQTDAQLISVGDSQQAIYGSFLGTSNALTELPSKHRAWLTQSFRFGPKVADVANMYLNMLKSEHLVLGNPKIESVVGPVDSPRAILCRTNASVVESALSEMKSGRRVAVVGGVDELVSFADGAAALQAGGRSDNPQLACFNNWDEVVDYVENDPNGGELKLLVKLVDEFGAAEISAAMRRTTTEHSADVIVSTAHRSKGRQWSTVRVAGGFAEPDEVTGQMPSDEELRLQYVAGSRAQFSLDPVGLFACREHDVLGDLFDDLVA